MDQTEAASKHIKNIIRDISENLQSKTEEFRALAMRFKEKYLLKTRNYSSEQAKLTQSLEDEAAIEQGLNSKKDLLKQSLEKEEIDLAKLDKENQELVDHIKSLEHTNKGLLEKQIDAEDKGKNLDLKCRTLKERNDIKFMQQKVINDKFKQFIGLDIIKVKDNIVKIVFSNLEHNCYVVVDFSRTDCVSETQPELNLEKLNYAFKEKANFYEFVKFVREELKQKV